MAPTAPTGSGRDPRSLILTVTRACDLRCSYCPTAKDDWPSLSPGDAVLAVRLFAERYGGGEVKLFGGEPLLVPDVVEAVFEAAQELPAIRRVQLSTNGLGLDDRWLASLAADPKSLLQISIDGAADDHRRFRRSLPGVPDSYERLMALLPRLLTHPRLVVTQTIPPATAARAAANFEHLRSLGFRRFNLLPGYYLPWSDRQLADLRAGFDAIGASFRAGWEAGDHLYLRNLFVRAPLPFFNSGLVVDADRTIHPANVGLSGQLDGLRGRTMVGTLDDPPSAEALAARSGEVGAMLREATDPRTWASTVAVDAELTRLCRSLYAEWAAWKKRGRSPAP